MSSTGRKNLIFRFAKASPQALKPVRYMKVAGHGTLSTRLAECRKQILAASFESSVARKVFGADVIIIDARFVQHAAQTRHHAGRPSNVVDGRVRSF